MVVVRSHRLFKSVRRRKHRAGGDVKSAFEGGDKAKAFGLFE
jgi:hypothetical protein